MKFRYAVAFPLIVWYLMRPPLPRLDPNVFTNAVSPLARWEIVERFPTRKECEVHLRDSRWVLCVASDDTRLNDKSVNESYLQTND
jgi:hypothetical protein